MYKFWNANAQHSDYSQLHYIIYLIAKRLHLKCFDHIHTHTHTHTEMIIMWHDKGVSLNDGVNHIAIYK